MLRPQPSRLPLLHDLETNLVERIAEAERHVWLGEVKELNNTLEALRDKTAHAQRLVTAGLTDTPVPMQ
jgi:hypothetical protein